MGQHNHTNGKDHSFDDLLERHDRRFDTLEDILRKGFGDLTYELRELRTVLVNAAAGKRQVPLSAFTVTQAIWAVLCILLLVKITMVDLDVSATGAKFQFKDNDRSRDNPISAKP